MLFEIKVKGGKELVLQMHRAKYYLTLDEIKKQFYDKS